ncbi:CPR-like [Trema orientale]|uniref:CPR-like n=1 Tax=Trema orientale TaxID=63057 RepID=A0A2P5BPX6_TREOI|nr:CPR-like [Trema orientale]
MEYGASTDTYLSACLQICASAVRESLANDFGDTFDSFVRNFEKSFGSTFRTLKLIKESSVNKGNNHLSHLTMEGSTPDVPHDVKDCVQGGGTTSSFSIGDYHTEELFRANETEYQFNHSAAMEQNELIDTVNLELALHGQRNQLSCVSPSPFGSVTNQSMLSTIEKSVMEQTRSNDLKTLELSLSMKKLKLKEDALALNYDSNNLERSKLAMGISKASFKVEKFKTQLEDVRHAELLRKCIDCLVAGLLIMVGSLFYATYVHSYQKITDATASCTPSSKASKSWWIPNPMASINSGIQILSCQFQVVVRMVFGVLMIICVAYLLLQRSSSSKQTMPVTFIILLLAFACGFTGKVCVDTLGGSGYHWLLYWETICLVHFFCNVCTSTLFFLLYGPLNVSPGMKYDTRLPYWTRRFLFYGMLLVFLPMLCGLIPFAGLGEWTNHFLLRIADYMSATED